MRASLYSWGRYPACPQVGHSPAWGDQLGAALTAASAARGTTLAYGNGRSYGDSCLAHSGHVVAMRGLDRILAVDWARGVLRAEAGILLADIIACALPHGWFLPVTPGTRFVTLGGAIANDVHGKNHHQRGTFGCHVSALGLFREGEMVECSPAQEPALFAASVGGLGLSGVICWAELRLLPVRSRKIDVLMQRFDSLAAFFALSAERDAQHEYAVAWVDCARRRGVYFWGDHGAAGAQADRVNLAQGPAAAAPAVLPGRIQASPPAARLSLVVPFMPPLSLVNSWSVAAFNFAYWHRHPAQAQRGEADIESFFYPLDQVGQWNRIYGRKGFQQFQCVVPDANAEVAIGAILGEVRRAGAGSFLAVLKRCGDVRSPGWLSFPLAGTSLAMDFPARPDLHSLLRRLDDIVREAGGRLYPAKDAHMSGADFRVAYPDWEKVERLRDPRLLSRFWRRVVK